MTKRKQAANIESPRIIFLGAPSKRGKLPTTTEIHNKTELRRVLERELDGEQLDAVAEEATTFMIKALHGDVCVLGPAGALIAVNRLLSIEVAPKICATLGELQPEAAPTRNLGDDPEPDSDQDLDRRAG